MKEITLGPYSCKVGAYYQYVYGPNRIIENGWESIEKRQIDIGSIRVIDGKLCYCVQSEETIRSKYGVNPFRQRKYDAIWAPFIFPTNEEPRDR